MSFLHLLHFLQDRCTRSGNLISWILATGQNDQLANLVGSEQFHKGVHCWHRAEYSALCAVGGGFFLI